MSDVIRPLSPADDLDELTRLLNDAYKGLGARGLKFVATWQDTKITRHRISLGECFVALTDGALTGTICLYGPGPTTGSNGHCTWYLRPDVARLGQFGVRPDARGRGLGRSLLRCIENRARDLGARELSLDTAEPATDLIGMYERWGFRRVAMADWDATNYLSVVLSKTL